MSAHSPQADLPDQIQPLFANVPDEAMMAAHARNMVKNVLDSYTGRFDVLAESIQNSMDALEKKWATTKSLQHGKPELAIELDANLETITVIDNGTGIARADLETALKPHLSPKALDPEPTRGHKGVGTTFLAYGHPRFRLNTKTLGNPETGYELTGGLPWAKDSAPTSPPAFEKREDVQYLSAYESGTCVVIEVGDDTRFGRLKTAQYNKLSTWSLVLRTFTALGQISIGKPFADQPWWVANLRVTLTLKGVSGAGSAELVPAFQFPHEDSPAQAANLHALSAGTLPQSSRFELLYLAYDSATLDTVLAPQLAALADSEQQEDQELLQSYKLYDVAVYASWAYKNTWYEDLFRSRIEEEAKRYQYNNVRSGLLVASMGMPIGETNDHPYVTMKPEYKRRLFVAVNLNSKYSPDMGRKTIPAADRRLMVWLEQQLQSIFLKHIHRLIKSNDDVPHSASSFDEAKEQLTSAAKTLRNRWDSLAPLGRNLGISRSPVHEAELEGMFFSLLSRGLLPGYRLIAVPGSRTRYDGYFDFEAREFVEVTPETHLPLGIAKTKASQGTFARTGKWLEFKLRLEDLVEEFNATDGTTGKKYFELLDLAVVWSVPLSDSVFDFDLTEYDSSTWPQRSYFGATHRLGTSHSQHTVDVVAIQSLLAILAPDDADAD